MQNEQKIERENRSFDFTQASDEACKDLITGLEALLANPTFGQLQMAWADQVAMRINGLVNIPLTSTDQCLQMEYSKGAIFGFKYCTDLPQALIDAIREELEIREEHKARKPAADEGEGE
jgi:hypothetical protein